MVNEIKLYEKTEENKGYFKIKQTGDIILVSPVLKF